MVVRQLFRVQIALLVLMAHGTIVIAKQADNDKAANHSAQTRSLGIDFSAIEPGTRFIVERYSLGGARYVYTYVGEKNNRHQVTNAALRNGKTAKPHVSLFYDRGGRLVRVERVDGTNSTYKPYSCKYVVGDCEHIHTYPTGVRKAGKTKYLTRKRQFRNRLEGNILQVGHVRRDGSLLVFPFTLDENNWRIESNFTTRVGKRGGFSTVKIIKP